MDHLESHLYPLAKLPTGPCNTEAVCKAVGPKQDPRWARVASSGLSGFRAVALCRNRQMTIAADFVRGHCTDELRVWSTTRHDSSTALRTCRGRLITTSCCGTL